MRTQGGYVRLASGVWMNMDQAKLMRVFVDAGEGSYRIEVLGGDDDGWLASEHYETEGEAIEALDQFFQELAV